ncbi:hypothetical protein SLS59_009343 [Nothophoma quercina]|uniref:Uncharacterized protein n=1 Tax=Nothophoma quercina TaxID=749835 RepID=A0ABR3QNA6_9PLEO
MDITRRNQLDSPLLRLPAEIRNEISKLVVRAGYDKKLRSQALLKRGRDWTRTCKQLHDEAGMLPFALYKFWFRDSIEYHSFVANTTAVQRAAMTVLSLRFLCSWAGEDMTWNGIQAPKMDLVATFAGLSELHVDILYACRGGLEFAKKWVSDMKKRNEGISFDVMFERICYADPFEDEEFGEDEHF